MTQHKLARYNSYKHSGNDLVGQIPQKWRLQRVKDVVSKIGNGVTPRGGSEVYQEDGIPFLRSQNVHDEGLELSNVSFISREIHDEMKGSRLREGDILFNITGASIGRTCMVPLELGEANLSQHVVFLRVKKRFNARYIALFLKSAFVKNYIRLEQNGASKEAFTLNQISTIPLVLPELFEQQTITNYLDIKTEQIDRKIDLLTQKAEKYADLKQSLINETVTRGVDKNVPLKDSGVKWIGQIPAHWKIARVKDSFAERSQKGYPEEPLLIASQEKGVVLKSTYARNTMTVQDDFHLMKLVRKNDFVISLRSFEGGIEIANHQGIISAAYTILISKDKDKIEFYKHLFKSSTFISMLATCTTGIREGRNVNYPQFMRELLPSPPQLECHRIAVYLDDKISRIDQIIESLLLEIENLQELRRTLINDVVTGKIKVSEA